MRQVLSRQVRLQAKRFRIQLTLRLTRYFSGKRKQEEYYQNEMISQILLE